MLERAVNFLKDVYSLKPKAWKERAQQLPTDVLQGELRGRQKLYNINVRINQLEAVGGVLAFVYGSTSGMPWLMWTGLGIIIGSSVVHLPVSARTQRRIEVLSGELQTRLSPVEPGAVLC